MERSGTIQEMLEAEMTQHLGYDPYERSELCFASYFWFFPKLIDLKK